MNCRFRITIIIALVLCTTQVIASGNHVKTKELHYLLLGGKPMDTGHQVESYTLTVNKIHIAVHGSSLAVNNKKIVTNDCMVKGTRIKLAPNGSTEQRILLINYYDQNNLLVTKDDFDPRKSELTNVRIKGHKVYRDQTEQGWLYYCPITGQALITQESPNIVPKMFREAVASFRGVK